MSYYASYFPSGIAGIGASSAARRLVRTVLTRARVIHRLLRPLNSFDALVSEDDGRVFFNSFDALVPQDIDGREDVYEWEPEGVGRNTNQTNSGQATKPSQARRKVQRMIEIAQNQIEGRGMSLGLQTTT